MWLVWLGVALLVLKFAAVPVFVELSWWWVALPFALAFAWFQIEERFGFDKKKAMDEVERAKRERIRKALDPKTNVRARR